jgi:hypothetical protein
VSEPHPIESLVSNLETLTDLLDRHQASHWVQWMKQSMERIQSGDPYGLGFLLRAFGGMGSLNDLVLSDAQDNRRLSDLRSAVYAAASSMTSEASDPR